MWFTESAWQPMALCGVFAIGFAAAWYQNRRMLWLAGILVSLLLIPGVWLLEQQIVTERERVEQRILDVTTAFKQQDVPTLLSCFAVNNLADRALATGVVAIVQVHDDLQIRDVSVTLTSGGNRAISRFRANGTFELRTYRGYHPSRWEVVWEKIANEWKIIRVTRLDPVTGESMGIMQSS